MSGEGAAVTAAAARPTATPTAGGAGQPNTGAGQPNTGRPELGALLGAAQWQGPGPDGAGEGTAARPGDELLTCTQRRDCDRFAGPGISDGWPSWLTEDEWYALLYEMYVAPPTKASRDAPGEQARRMRRAGRRLRYMENWRFTSERIKYQPVMVGGCALRMDAGNRCCWCDCPLEPCLCGGSPLEPARPLPKAAPSVAKRMLFGQTGKSKGGWKPPHAWSWRGRMHTMAVKLQKAAAEGCLCALRRVGPPACPAPLLDLPCDRDQAFSYEARSLRRQLEQMREDPAERAAREREEAKSEPFEWPSGLKGRSVGTQTAAALGGALDPGEGRVLMGSYARWTIRRAGAKGTAEERPAPDLTKPKGPGGFEPPKPHPLGSRSACCSYNPCCGATESPNFNCNNLPVTLAKEPPK